MSSTAWNRTNGTRLVAASLAFGLTLAACGRETEREEPSSNGSFDVETVSSVETLIATEDFVLASPVDLDITPAGSVYVLDFGMPAIVRVEPGGEVQTIVEGEGAGPGELSAPIALAVEDDTLRVIERGNGRIQILTTDGEYVRSRPTVPGVDFGATIREDGRIAVPTGGLRDSALVRIFDEDGELVGALGELVAPAADLLHFGRIKAEIADGEVPDQIRNLALPILGDDGSLWIALLADGIIRRYGESNEVLWETQIDLPEMSRIKAQFLARNRELANNPATYSPLEYFVDGQAVGEELWLLLNMPEGEASVIVVLGGDGSVERKVVVPGIEEARAFAIDPVRNRLYLVGGTTLVAAEFRQRDISD